MRDLVLNENKMSSSSFENDSKAVSEIHHTEVESFDLGQAVSLEDRQDFFAQRQTGNKNRSVINEDGAEDGSINFGGTASVGREAASLGDTFTFAQFNDIYHKWNDPFARLELHPEPVGGLELRQGGRNPESPVYNPLGRDRSFLQELRTGEKGGVVGGSVAVLNFLTLGFSDVIGRNAGTDKLTDKLVEHGANLLTLGGYEGYKEGGMSGIPAAIAKTVLPIEEACVVAGVGHDSTWDQRMLAAGLGSLKLASLGKMTGKYVSSHPITQAQIDSIKYGYHFTTKENAAKIMQSGFESRLPGTKGGAAGAISNIARGIKDLFVDNEPEKAGYMWGTTRPGAGRFGDIDYKQPPLVIDLSKVNPRDLMVRPPDGAIVFVGDKIPPSALSSPANWSEVPLSPTPLTGNPLANLRGALPYTGGIALADQSFNEIDENGLR